MSGRFLQAPKTAWIMKSTLSYIEIYLSICSQQAFHHNSFQFTFHLQPR